MLASKTRFVLLGNRLCVDFANTVLSPDRPDGAINSWYDLINFLEATETITSLEATRLLALNEKNRKACTEVFTYALTLRAVVREILTNISKKHSVSSEQAAAINDVLRSNEGYQVLIPTVGNWRLTHITRNDHPMTALFEIALSMAELITEEGGAPVHRCDNPKCVLFFYDTSRTGRRRWCSMAVCGNRMKVAAFTERSKQDNTAKPDESVNTSKKLIVSSSKSRKRQSDNVSSA